MFSVCPCYYPVITLSPPVFLPVSAKYLSLKKNSLVLPGIDHARMIPSYSVILCENVSENIFELVSLKCSYMVRLQDLLIRNMLKNPFFACMQIDIQEKSKLDSYGIGFVSVHR